MDMLIHAGMSLILADMIPLTPILAIEKMTLASELVFRMPGVSAREGAIDSEGHHTLGRSERHGCACLLYLDHPIFRTD
jgi:hypothetical protein